MKHLLPLMALLAGGCHLPDPDVSDDRVAVLFSSRDDLEVRGIGCPDGRCRFLDLEVFSCAGQVPAATVVLTGHSTPPMYLQTDAGVVAAAVACLEPALLVLDTCYGFSSPLLDALAARGLSAWVVGATWRLPPEGLRYSSRFFSGEGPDAEARSAWVEARSGAKLERWRIDPVKLEAVHAALETWAPSRLEANLVRVLPNLVRVAVPGADVAVVVPVPMERFRR